MEQPGTSLSGRIRGWLPRSPWQLVPGIAGLRGYDRRRQGRPDLIAGITVAAVAIPAGLGMGELAGVSPVAGLYATLLPLAAYCLIGSSKQLIVGPEGTLSALTATTVLPIAVGHPELIAPLAAALALAIGAVQIAAGLLRLGFMADFLSKPVLGGYSNGVALIIIVSQIGKVLGVKIPAAGFFPQVWHVLQSLGTSSVATAVLSASFFAVFYLVKWFLPRIPASLVIVIIGDAASVLFHLGDRGIATIGHIPTGLPGFALPGITFGQWTRLGLSAVGIALVGFADAIAISRTYAAKHGYDIDANRELIGLGTSNISAGLTHAIAVGSSSSRTALNDSIGGTSQVTALVAAALAALVAAFATALIEPLPTAVLGVVIITAAIGLINIRAITRLRHVQHTEVGLALATLLGVLVFNVLGGLLLAVGLSVGVYVYRSVRPHDAVLASVTDLDGYHDITEYPEASDVPGMLVYRFDAPLYFANAAYFTDRLTTLVDAADPPPRWVVFNAESVNYLDATAVDALTALQTDLSERGITFALARVHSPIQKILNTSGYAQRHGNHLIFGSVRAAVDAYQHTPPR